MDRAVPQKVERQGAILLSPLRSSHCVQAPCVQISLPRSNRATVAPHSAAINSHAGLHPFTCTIVFTMVESFFISIILCSVPSRWQGSSIISLGAHTSSTSSPSDILQSFTASLVAIDFPSPPGPTRISHPHDGPAIKKVVTTLILSHLVEYTGISIYMDYIINSLDLLLLDRPQQLLMRDDSRGDAHGLQLL